MSWLSYWLNFILTKYIKNLDQCIIRMISK